jgi:hypothetical protein
MSNSGVVDFRAKKCTKSGRFAVAQSIMLGFWIRGYQWKAELKLYANATPVEYYKNGTFFSVPVLSVPKRD